MADTTEFDHDQLGHLLADHLLEVPRFQRSYSWDRGNVEEFLADLARARQKQVSYFMGTVVFARPEGKSGRRQIVDGQQRLATTAVLIVAIRDALKAYGKAQQATKTDERYLRGYVLSAEAIVERLILSPTDQESYDALLEERAGDIDPKDPLRTCYEACRDHLAELAPTSKQYKNLLEVADQLESKVQVLVAVASDLPEAYVIFETLNDRGADLTTADLLKNYLFSLAKDHFRYVETKWIALEADFDKPEDLVKFIRYDHVSRHGPTTTRQLYRAIQEQLGDTATGAKKYVESLSKAQEIYLALRDPDSSYWSDIETDVRDALLAYRRFGFESSFPTLLAAFQTWKKPAATALLIKMAKWSVRGLVAGRIGASLSEESFGDAAAAISSGTAKNQTAVRTHLERLIPNDTEFRAALTSYGPISTSRAKYMLAMLEKANAASKGKPAPALEWYSRGITIEHILPQSAATQSDAAAAAMNTIGNLTLLEKKINRDLGSKPFPTKKAAYATSEFELTKALADESSWSVDQVNERSSALAKLACSAWPAT